MLLCGLARTHVLDHATAVEVECLQSHALPTLRSAAEAIVIRRTQPWPAIHLKVQRRPEPSRALSRCTSQKFGVTNRRFARVGTWQSPTGARHLERVQVLTGNTIPIARRTADEI